tara:strand:+ start:346 stop:492 length:147 start_codon:yes stop_codon:yes gene_type:complete
MKYLTPEIEALSKNFDVSNSLVKRNVSCGIFQDSSEDTYIMPKDPSKD